MTERNGVSMFLALVDDECHELIPGSHSRWRTPYEHDVLLPQAMKDAGVPHTPSWNGKDPLPGQVAIRLKPVKRSSVTVRRFTQGTPSLNVNGTRYQSVGRNGRVSPPRNRRWQMCVVRGNSIRLCVKRCRMSG